MKKFIAGIAMMLVCAVAFAMPSPKMIEDSLASGRYQEARGMVQEVLREKPDSARAHLLNSYILIHADKDRAGAGRELDMANALDKKGDVRNSALFGRVAAEIDLQRTAQPPKATAMPLGAHPQPVEAIKQPTPSYPTYSAADSSKASNFWLFVIVLGVIGCLAVMVVLIIRRNHEKPPISYPLSYEKSKQLQTAYAGNRVTYDPPAPVLPQVRSYPQMPTVHQAPQREPMGAMGTAASVAGGVVAGNVLSDMLLHSHRNSSHAPVHEEVAKPQQPEQYVAPEPSYSYSSSRDSFSSGKDDSWSNRNDSSSSYSSGSDSSSWDSGSSDSGSSSSSWD